MGKSYASGIFLSQYSSGADVSSALADMLRGCNVESVLRLTARVAVEQLSSKQARISNHVLALVLRFLLESATEHQEGDRQLTRDELELCCEMASAVIESPNMALGVPVPDGALSLTHRVAYQRLPDQEQRYVPRSLTIYREIAPGLQEDVGFNFEADFNERFGLSLDDVWELGFGLYRWCLDNSGVSFSVSEIATMIPLTGVDERKMKNFLQLTAGDCASYRSLLKTPADQPHFEPYSINPLRKLPVIRISNGEYIVPIPGYLLRRVTHGLYYDLIELDRGGFIKLVGRSFREYVGKILGECLSKNQFQFDGHYWAVSDSDITLYVACVTRPFGALSRSTGDPLQVRRDLSRRGGLIDVVKGLQHITKKPPDGGVSHGKQVVGLVVALEDFFFANGPFIRGIIDQVLESQGSPPIDGNIQLAHVRGLEAVCSTSAATNAGIGDIIAGKVNRPEFSGLELDTYACHFAMKRLDGKPIDLTPNLIKKAGAQYLG